MVELWSNPKKQRGYLTEIQHTSSILKEYV